MPPSSPIAASGASTSRSTRSIRDKFRAITRWGDLDKVMAGIDAAQAAGLKVKLNAVALKGFNEAELPEMLRWAHGRGMDLTVIETMPMGEIDADRTDQYLPLSLLRANLERSFTLDATSPTRPAARPAMSRSRRPADGSASSRR